ncbi:hypothetical protein LDENG_00029500 [Lucifuga dentata]|nr:hypothetical protein LDENG_00029500 [Lucifuga dentata]
MTSWSQGHHNPRKLEPSFRLVQRLKIPSQRDKIKRDRREKWDGRLLREDLSRDDLLFLLSMLEGELQAREEESAALKAEKTHSALLETHYDIRVPEMVLCALQRDSLQAQQDHQQDVYKTSMAKLNALVEAQKQSSRLMLEQFVEVTHAHGDTLSKLEEQERSHRAFVQKSNNLTTLLEQDRERLKLLLVKEREYQEIKEKKSRREVSTLKKELTKLKAFALLVVKEQQCMSDLLEEQRQCVQQLTAITDRTKQALSAAYSRAKEEELKSLHLETELQNRVSIFYQTQKTMTAKLVDEDAQNQQLRHQLVAFGHQFDDLEGKRNVLKKAEEELWELRGRMRHVENGGERGTGTPSLLSEVEVLRRRVVEMEGKDEELIRMGEQCRDLDRRLTRKASLCHSLKDEVDKLSGRISELDRIEEALGKSKQECSILKSNLERERDVSKMLSTELDTLKVRVRELEAAENQLEKREAAIRQDLTKLRTLTVALVEDRKTMAERLQQAEEKLSKKEGKENEQNNSAFMTERLQEERQQALRSKADLEKRIMNIAKEKCELQARLKTEEDRNVDLQSKISMMKKRLQVSEKKEKEEKGESEKHICSSLSNSSNYYCQTEDNKVKELSQELVRLQSRLQEKEVLEGELMKMKEAFESLKRRFNDEQKRYQAFTEELEEARVELSKYQQAEKQDINQEHLLLCRLQQEQVKSRLLRREVEALKDKLQKLMGTEESISRVQVDHSTLQSKLTQQEARNRDLAREMEKLVKELDRYRGISSNIRPSATRQHFPDLQATKEVQTEPSDRTTSDYSSQASSLHNGKLDEDNDMEPNHNKEVINRTSSPLFSNLNSLNNANNNVSQYNGQSANGIDMHQTVNGEVMMLTRTPGQPLHIKVTPDHILNTATLEISSPTGDTSTSYTSTAVIPKSGAPPKQRITIIHNSALSAVKTKSSPSSPDCAISPLNETPIIRALSPNSSCSVAHDNNSPIQIVTVSSCSPEPTEITSQAVFCKTPDRQNSWHHLKSHSSNTSPSIITTEENKIHIHLGSPYTQSLNGITHSMPQSVGPYYVQQEQRTQVVTNGCHVKGVGKITSSITITPAGTPASHPSNITISGLCE